MKDKQNNIKNFTRGGQIWLNNFRMFNQVSGQLFSWVFWPVLIAGIAIGFYCLGIEKVFFFMKFYEAKTGIGLARILNPEQIQQKIMVFSYMGQEYQARYVDFVSNAYVINAVREVWIASIGVLIGTIGVTVSGIILSSTLFERRGAEQNETKLIRGSKIASVKEVAKYLVSKNNASTHTIECIRNPEAVESLLKDFNPDNQALYDKRVKVVNLPLTHNFEVRHVLIHGTTGSGKTQLIRSLLREIRRRGDKVILTDKGPVLAGEFFDSHQDSMLNPFDERCVNWDLWREALTGPDFDNLAESLIPSAAGSDDPFWTNAARTIFASAAYTMQDDPKRSIEKLLRLLLTAELSELQKYLSKTQAATLASKDIEKTALSIKAVLANHLKSLRFMKGLSRDKYGNKRPGFAIRDWILDEKQKGWLFITSNANQHASLRSLISMWLSMASISLLSLPPDSKRRIWIIMDELPSLHKLPQLPETMAQVRKYGGCFVLGMQSFVQLQKIYGDTAAKEMFDLLNTRFYFRNPSNEVARIISKDLGEEEVEILNENYSMGANSIRDGISVGKQRVVRPLVMPTDIMQLRDLQFYLKMAGDMPIVKTDLKLTVSQEIHPGFIARDMPSDKTLDEVIVVAEAATYARKVKSNDNGGYQLQDPDQSSDQNPVVNIDEFVEVPESDRDEGNPLLSSAYQESEIVSDSTDHAKSQNGYGIY